MNGNANWQYFQPPIIWTNNNLNEWQSKPTTLDKQVLVETDWDCSVLSFLCCWLRMSSVSQLTPPSLNTSINSQHTQKQSQQQYQLITISPNNNTNQQQSQSLTPSSNLRLLFVVSVVGCGCPRLWWLFIEVVVQWGCHWLMLVLLEVVVDWECCEATIILTNNNIANNNLNLQQLSTNSDNINQWHVSTNNNLNHQHSQSTILSNNRDLNHFEIVLDCDCCCLKL